MQRAEGITMKFLRLPREEYALMKYFERRIWKLINNVAWSRLTGREKSKGCAALVNLSTVTVLQGER